MGSLRFVALGDSLTEGKGDIYPDGRLRGFADMLAVSLRRVDPGVSYANLARPSVRAAEVRAQQLPAALALRPDLATVIIGLNDVIALRTDADRVGAELEAVVEGLRGAGCTVLTATLPDLTHVTSVAALWRARIARVNAEVRRVAGAARRPSCRPGGTRARDSSARHMALDRVHPGAHGHHLLASAFADVLGLAPPDVPFDLVARAPARRAAARGARPATAPPFVWRRLARRRFITSQPAKQPVALPVA